MHDLREAIDRLLEARVVAVDEDENLMLRRLANARVEGGDGGVLVEDGGFDRRELTHRVRSRTFRPLHFADRAIWGN